MDNYTIEQRMRLLYHMNEVVKAMSHEMAYEEWLIDYPEDAGYEELLAIAEDNIHFHEITGICFCNIIQYYGKYGWGV